MRTSGFLLLVALLSSCASRAAESEASPSAALPSAPSNAPIVERAGPTIEFAIVEPVTEPSSSSRSIHYKGATFAIEELRRFRFATASPSVDYLGNPAVSFVLDPRDVAEFHRWTGANIKRELAVLVDGRVTTLAVIRDALPGAGVISRSERWTEDEVRDLAERVHASGSAAPKTIDPAQPFALAAPYEPAPGSELVITLERTPCFGRCPAYTVAVRGDGTVTYEGRSDVKKLGEATRTVDAERVRGLLAHFAAVDFLALRDEYKMPVTDLPSTILTLRVNGRAKRVVNYWARGVEDAPDVDVHQMLDVLAEAVDMTSGSAGWVK
ncbi:MAG: DUF6438 domain-containing protein [Planctomycetota bacterium]